MTHALSNLSARGSMLTHFTRASITASALDNLMTILSEGRIRGGSRMVLGGQPVVCFCDAPLAELRHMLVRANRRRYEPFGLAVDRRFAFQAGARPALYMSTDEAEQIIDAEEMWRVVTLDLERDPPVDWTYEREWRLAGDLTLPGNGPVALVENWKDADELYDHFNGNPPCAGVIPLSELLGSA
ncbi:MAG TPA: hypothetical protein VHY56_05120 [Candidatus Binataceae bacterium]|jgi:hypothetical protein|nr:hypothetical protein [Candidatus Binataceae bacterium]